SFLSHVNDLDLRPAAGAHFRFVRPSIYSGREPMKLPHRRQFLHLAAGAVAMPAVSRKARAQTYPMRPVRVIVPTAPGGFNDILSRLIGQWLSERLGQSFIIENRPGGGNNIGTEVVVRSSPDGYTLLMMSTTNAINATLYEKLNYNFIRDLVAVAAIASTPNILVTNPSVPAKTALEFIGHAKSHPGKINMASAGHWALLHFFCEAF